MHFKSQPSFIIACVALCVLFSSASLHAAERKALGNAAHGQILVRNWCSNCHDVTDVSAGIPPLQALQKDARRAAPKIRGFLTNPHTPMPSLDLTHQEVEDIIAFLRIPNMTP